MGGGNDDISSEEHFDNLNISRGSYLYLELFQFCSYFLIPSRDLFPLKGLSHEIDFKNFDKNLQNLA